MEESCEITLLILMLYIETYYYASINLIDFELFMLLYMQIIIGSYIRMVIVIYMFANYDYNNVLQ